MSMSTQSVHVASTIRQSLPSSPTTFVAEGIHQVHVDIAGRADMSDGNNLTEINWVTHSTS